MKTKIKLTKEQIEMLIEKDEKILREKFEKDISLLKRKYEFVEIDLNAPVKQPQKEKITDETFVQYFNQNMSAKSIASLTGYNEGYIYRIRKRLLIEK